MSLIVGGGFVGLALACGLAESGLEPVVVEAGDPQAALAASFDGRASAIALTPRRLLEGIGWPKLAGKPRQCLRSASRKVLHACSCTMTIAKSATNRSATCWRTARCDARC